MWLNCDEHNDDTGVTLFRQGTGDVAYVTPVLDPAQLELETKEQLKRENKEMEEQVSQ